VEQGRIIYGNIRKFVFYLLSCNVAEVGDHLPGCAGRTSRAVDGDPTPVAQSADRRRSALALGMEKGDPDIMEQPPRPPGEPIINRIMIIRIAVMAVALTGVVLAAFLVGWMQGDRRLAQTLAFATLALAELPIAYTTRSERYLLTAIGVLSNHWMQRASGLSLALILAVMYVPFLNEPFNTVPLGSKSGVLSCRWPSFRRSSRRSASTSCGTPLSLFPGLAACLEGLLLPARQYRKRPFS